MKKLGGFLLVLLLSILLIGAGKAYAGENLLVNGSAEAGMTGWTETADSEGIWMLSTPSTKHDPIDGEKFFWPGEAHCVYACMYQDVDVSGIGVGSWMTLSAWLANYDQNPHDQATIKIQIFDSSNTLLYEDYSLQRNPEWQHHEVNFTLPKNAQYARVLCIADRFVGEDNDAYFDAISLSVSDSKISQVVITGKKNTAKPGDTIQLSVTDGKYSKATDYEWSSSYNEIATVDKNGLVTMAGDPDSSLVGAEVWIYAKNKKTGVIGRYFINSSRENAEDAPSEESKTDKKSSVNKVKTLSAVSVKLSWTKSSNAGGYYIYQYNGSSKKYVKIATIKKAKTTTYTVNNLKMNKEYKFKVVAYAKKNGKTVTSDDSNIIKVSFK